MILKSMPIVGNELSSLIALFSEEYLARSQLFPTVLSPIIRSFRVGGSAAISSSCVMHRDLDRWGGPEVPQSTVSRELLSDKFDPR